MDTVPHFIALSVKYFPFWAIGQIKLRLKGRSLIRSCSHHSHTHSEITILGIVSIWLSSVPPWDYSEASCDIFKPQQREKISKHEKLLAGWKPENRAEKGNRKRRRKERTGVIPTELSVQTSEEKQRKKSRKIKGKYRREQQNLSGVFNLNPKSTGLLKHGRSGSSSAFLSHYKIW